MKSRLVVGLFALTLAGGAAAVWLLRPAADHRGEDTIVAEAIALEQAGDRDGAGRLYEAALAADPTARAARLRLAKLRFNQARYAEAVPIMMRAAEENPADGELLVNIGTALLKLDRNVEGIEWLTRAVAVAPDDAAAHHNLGVALAKELRYAEAAAQFERTLELKPDHHSAGRNLQIVRRQMP